VPDTPKLIVSTNTRKSYNLIQDGWFQLKTKNIALDVTIKITLHCNTPFMADAFVTAFDSSLASWKKVLLAYKWDLAAGK